MEPDFDNSDVTPTDPQPSIEPPLPPTTGESIREPDMPEAKPDGRKGKKCPESGCGNPGRGPRNGWRCDEHKVGYHASRGGEKPNTPGPPPLSKEPFEDIPQIELPDELGLAEMGAAYLLADAKRQEQEGWPIRLGEPFIKGLWLPMAKYLETELMRSMAGKIDKKQMAGIVVGAPFVNSAAFRISKKFSKKKTPPIAAAPVSQPIPEVKVEPTSQAANQAANPVEEVKPEPANNAPRTAARTAGGYSIS